MRILSCRVEPFTHWHLMEMIKEVHYALDNYNYMRADEILKRVHQLRVPGVSQAEALALGDAFAHAKQYKFAQQLYGECIDDIEANKKLVDILLELGEYEQAELVLRVMLACPSMRVDTVELKLKLGQILEKQDQLDQACHVYESIHQYHTGAAVLYMKCLFQLNQPIQARNVLASIQPTLAAQVEMYDLVADVMVLVKEMDDALLYYQKYIQLKYDPSTHPDLSATDVIDKLMLTQRPMQVQQIYTNLMKIQCNSNQLYGCIGLSTRVAMLDLMLHGTTSPSKALGPETPLEIWQVVGMNMIKTYSCGELDQLSSRKDLFGAVMRPLSIPGLPETFLLPADATDLRQVSTSSVWIVKPIRGTTGI